MILLFKNLFPFTEHDYILFAGPSGINNRGNY